MTTQTNNLSVTFYGGADSVTGANFLLATRESTKILVDCGLFQGAKVVGDLNYQPFPYDPRTIDFLFITHAHLDHIGRIPKLVREGFRGAIYSTPPTKEIAELSLVDSLGVMGKEAKSSRRPLLYTEEDIRAALALWQTVEYHESVRCGSLTAVLRDAGHILGSAMVEFSCAGRKIIFSGDLGNSPMLLLRDTELISDASYLIMESVYGDRRHDDQQSSREKLEDTIEETIKAGGTLLIPAFSIERTQVMLYEIEQMMDKSRIPLVPVFLDSPLAILVTAVYKKYRHYWNPTALAAEASGEDLFNFPQLQKTLTTEASRAIDRLPWPKIIIAGSGMSNGGRIIHHEKRFLTDQRSTLLLVGYQTAGSLGRILQDGAKLVKILGEEIVVRAKTVSLSGYSAHKDSDALLDFVRQTSDTLKKVFVAMGEPHSSLHLVQRIRDYLGLEAAAPQRGETAILDLS